MVKTTGLNTRIYAAGYNLSGDVSSLSGVGIMSELYDVTTLSDAAVSRLSGLASGTVSVSAFMDTAAGRDHALWTSGTSGAKPTADQTVLIPLDASAIGGACLGMDAKQATYNIERPTGSALAASVDYASADGSSPEWGVMLTAGSVTDSSGTAYTAHDNGSSTSNGAAGYAQLFSLTSGTVVWIIEHSTDNVTYSTLLSFTSAAALTGERVATAAGATVNRYTRLVSSGTFSTAQLAAGIARL